MCRYESEKPIESLYVLLLPNSAGVWGERVAGKRTSEANQPTLGDESDGGFIFFWWSTVEEYQK